MKTQRKLPQLGKVGCGTVQFAGSRRNLDLLNTRHLFAIQIKRFCKLVMPRYGLHAKPTIDEGPKFSVSRLDGAVSVKWATIKLLPWYSRAYKAIQRFFGYKLTTMKLWRKTLKNLG